MSRVVGVRFKTAGKVYYFDPGEIELQVGDGAVVETARGMEMGMVTAAPREVPEEEIKQPLKKVVRKASPEDLARRQENEERAKKAFAIGQQKIVAHGLPMKLVEVEYTLDGSKIIFYFTAESRVDFRDLVKDLASTFRTRIELRQIGVRDEAKLLGGLGPCGRQLCCQAFLGDFVPVSIRMAKEQNLSLNPTKISGICGRLMCCLNYESEAYREAKRLEKERVALEAARLQEQASAPESGETDERPSRPEAGAPQPGTVPARPVPPARRPVPTGPRQIPAAPRQAPEAPASEGEPLVPTGVGVEGGAERAGSGRRRRRRRRPGGGEKGQSSQAVDQSGPPSATAQAKAAGESGETGSGHKNHRRRRHGSRPGSTGGDGGNRGGSPAE